MREAEKRIKADLLRYADLGALTPGQKINQIRLAALTDRLDGTIKGLKAEHTLALKTAAKESHLEGITQTRGYCRMVDATYASVFEPDMIVTFWNTSDAETFKRVVHAVNADYVYFTASTSVGSNSSGTLAEYRKIDSSADFRDRILTVISTSRYSLYNAQNFMPNGNDKGTWGATAGATAYGNFRMNVSQVYTELGIDFSQTGWSDQETGSGAAMVYVPGGSQDSGSQGWRVFADDYDGDLWIAYAHATWDGIFDVSTYKGGRANFYVMILASPDLGGYV